MDLKIKEMRARTKNNWYNQTKSIELFYSKKFGKLKNAYNKQTEKSNSKIPKWYKSLLNQK